MPPTKRQTRLASAHFQQSTIRKYGSTPSSSLQRQKSNESADDQSTLTQLWDTRPPPSPPAFTKPQAANKKKTKGRKRKSYDYDEGNSILMKEEETEEGYLPQLPHIPEGLIKRRRLVVENTYSDEMIFPSGSDECGRLEDVKQEEDEEEPEENWQPEYIPRRQRGKRKNAGRSVSRGPSAGSDQTSAQMDLNINRTNDVSESGFMHVKQEIQGEEPVLDVDVGSTQDSDDAHKSNDEEEMEADVESAREQTDLYQDAGKENVPGNNIRDTVDQTDETTAAAPVEPKTPKKKFPQIIPSSYTPPITPLSPLRRTVLVEACLRSPIADRVLRKNMTPLKVARMKMRELSVIAEGLSQPEVDGQDLEQKQPDHTDNPTTAGRTDADATPKAISKEKIVQSSQWWERDEAWSNKPNTGPESVLNLETQKNAAGGGMAYRQTGEFLKPETQEVGDSNELEFIPESPLKKRLRSSYNAERKTVLSEHKTVDSQREERVANDNSQRTEMSSRSVDRQLLLESDDYINERVRSSQPLLDKEIIAGGKILESAAPEESEDNDRTPIRRRQTMSSTLQSLPGHQRTSSAGKHTRDQLVHQSSTYVPLLPPSSPPLRSQAEYFSPPSSPTHAVFHSPSNTPSHSTHLADLTNVSAPVRPDRPQNLKTDDHNSDLPSSSSMESLDLYSRAGPVETHTQWKMRMFGPSQAVPTLSQILPESLLQQDSIEDDEEEEEL